MLLTPNSSAAVSAFLLPFNALPSLPPLVPQDPKNKQFAICDDELRKVVGKWPAYRISCLMHSVVVCLSLCTGVKRFRLFGMMKVSIGFR